MSRYDPKGERATRDIVSRAIYAEMRAGRVTPHGGVYISMGYLGPERVRKEFKGMVERCADCGFDLAGGLVEVVPTAHYMMGGVVFGADCSTELQGLFTAGEDTGGVHGENRQGGNGVANSTVFGGIAGDAIQGWIRKNGIFHEPDEAAIERGIAAARMPLGKPAGDLEAIRERLYDVMWDEVGIVRDAVSLDRAAGVSWTRGSMRPARRARAGFNLTARLASTSRTHPRLETTVCAAAREDPRRALPRDLPDAISPTSHTRVTRRRALRHHHAAGGVHAGEARETLLREPA
jgi:succinate dehydrogenase/fumarate reductase flavoprotein subunit